MPTLMCDTDGHTCSRLRASEIFRGLPKRLPPIATFRRGPEWIVSGVLGRELWRIDAQTGEKNAQNDNGRCVCTLACWRNLSRCKKGRPENAASHACGPGGRVACRSRRTKCGCPRGRRAPLAKGPPLNQAGPARVITPVCANGQHRTAPSRQATCRTFPVQARARSQ